MADATIPGAVVNQNPTNIPIDSQPVGFGEGFASSFGAAMRSGPGSSLETQIIGKLQGGGAIPYDQVKKVFEDQKLDPTVFPKGQDVSQGEAIAVMGQQLAIQRDQDLAARAKLSTPSQWVSGFAGSFADPAGLALGLIAGPVMGAASKAVQGGRAVATGAGALARVGTGAAEGAAFGVGFGEAEKHFGTAQGDRDITSGQILHDALWGTVLGGGLKGAFGERASRVDLEPYRQMIVGAENTAGYAKAHGIPIEDVVSNKGAIGLYQITPGLAKDLGYNPDMLHNPAYAEQVAEAGIEKLYKKYGADPEAIAIAWNGGEGMADRFIKLGRRRSILPKETQDYLNRIEKLQRVRAIEPTPTPVAQPETAPVAPGAEVPPAPVEPNTEPAIAPPETHVAARDQGLVVARKMPDGTIQYGERGMIHADLLSEEEFDEIDREGGFVSSGGPGVDLLYPKHGVMGFARPGGEFLDRNEAAKLMGVENRPGGLESMHNEDLLARDRPPTKTDIAVAKTAAAQAAQGDVINVEPIMKAVGAIEHGMKPNEDWKSVIPTRNGELAHPDAKAALAKVEQTIAQAKPEAKKPVEPRAPHPAVAELQRLAKEDEEAAASIHAGLTGEAPGAEQNKFETYMKAEEQKFLESEGPEQQPEFQKALEAAVQCGLKRGTE